MVSLLLTLNRFHTVSIVDFKQVNAGWFSPTFQDSAYYWPEMG